jgi:hypothetical protein
MVREIALFGGLERHFCHEKRSSKKKGNSWLRGTSCSYIVIFDHRNDSLSLQKKHFGDDIP